MNLVGKILTGLIALLSVVFMSFALAVYATHTNWRDRVMNEKDGYQVLLKKEQEAKRELESLHDRLTKERDAERKAARDVAAALKTEVENLRRENADLKKSLAEEQERVRKAVAAMQATQNNITTATAERDQLRASLAEARKDRDEQFKRVVELTDQVHQMANDLKALQDKYITLAQDLQKYKDLATMLGLTGDVNTLLQKVPPKVEGTVLTAEPTGLIEISLGSDDGLRKGHRLEVFRGPTYLGRVEVVEARPDRSVCTVIPEFRKGTIQKGDHVASNL